MTFLHGIIEDRTDYYDNEDTRWLSSSSSSDMINATTSTSTFIDNTDQSTTNSVNLELLSAVVTNILLFFLIFGLSATVDVKDYKKQITKNTSTVVIGNALQFLLMPFLGFLSIIFFHHWGYSKTMGTMLLILTSSPGGSYSNWWCSLVNADLSLSVAITSVSSILSIFMLPASIFFYQWLIYEIIFPEDTDSDKFTLDFTKIYIPLLVDIAGIFCGLMFGYIFNDPKFHRYANHLGSICGVLLIIVGFIFSFSSPNNSDAESTSLFTWPLAIGTAFPCLLGICLTNFIAIRFLNITRPETVALAIETCYQNNAIALSVAVTMFGNDPSQRGVAAIVPVFYGIVEIIVIAVYGIWAWKMGWTRAPPEASVCTVITTTYEVDDHDEEKYDDKNQNNRNNKGDEAPVIDTDDDNSSSSTIDTEAPPLFPSNSNSSDDTSLTTNSDFETLDDNSACRFILPLGSSDRRRSVMSISSHFSVPEGAYFEEIQI